MTILFSRIPGRNIQGLKFKVHSFYPRLDILNEHAASFCRDNINADIWGDGSTRGNGIMNPHCMPMRRWVQSEALKRKSSPLETCIIQVSTLRCVILEQDNKGRSRLVASGISDLMMHDTIEKQNIWKESKYRWLRYGDVFLSIRFKESKSLVTYLQPIITIQTSQQCIVAVSHDMLSGAISPVDDFLCFLVETLAPLFIFAARPWSLPTHTLLYLSWRPYTIGYPAALLI